MKFRELIKKIHFRGRGRLINLLFPSLKCVIPYGNESLIHVDTGEWIGWNIYWNGGYEQEVTWLLDHICKKDSVCVDIGANIGVYTLLLAEKSLHVHAIEPNPVFRKNLVRNISLNKFDNTSIHTCGISDTAGEVTMYCPPDSMANKSATIKKINNELTEQITIHVLPLDVFCEKFGTIDVIKIDCDGADADIILSGKESIAKHKPYIIFEDMGLMDFPSIERKYELAYQFLQSIGYLLFEIKRHHLEPIETPVKGRYANIFAAHCEH
ncbi:MAG: FkbM family methyltransferase [Polaromonas sp.]|nr:FkbM family methyltransferase [Polaromonas sp.]MDP3751404.1 FkbM family methyltransferase [Polaromonas sp.]